MTAVLSVPWSLAPTIGADLCRGGRGVWSRECEDRVYFVVPLLALWKRAWVLRPDVEVEWFRSEAEALAWVERDVRAWEVIQ